MRDNLNIIVRPRITEKASLVSETQGSYVFEVSKEATKKSIHDAVKHLYKVTPVKVNIVKLPSKKITMKGKSGRTGGVKKAYVYLKKGEKIEIA